MNVDKLIHSLTPLQQRYFRLYATLHVPEGKTAKYLEAFDLILKNKRPRNKSEESELFHLVLRVMRMYTSNGPAREVKNAIIDAEFLISKAMYDEASSLLKKAELLAIELELFASELDIINLRAELMQLAGFKKGASVGKVLLDELSVIERIENTAQYRQYSLTLFEKIRSKGKLGVKEQISYLRLALKDPLLRNENRAITLRSRIIRLQMHATTNLLEGNTVKALTFQKQLVDLMSDQPAHVRWKPFTHVILLNNYTITALRCGKFREAQSGISALRKMPEQFGLNATTELSAQLFSFAAVLELDLYIRKNELKTGVKKAESIMREMKRHEKYLPPSLHIVLIFNYGILLFMSGIHARAYSHFSQISQLNFIGVRADLQSAARLLQALCLYEKGDTDYLSYAVINLKRQAKKQKESYRSEILLLNAIGKAIDLDAPKRIVLWEKLKAKLENLKNDPLDAALYENFDILKWVEKQTNA